MRLPSVPVLLTLIALTPLAHAEDSTVLQTRLLNALDTTVLPNLAAWKVNGLSATLVSGVEPKLGMAAITLAGQAEIPGAKVDATLYQGDLAGCRELSLWVMAGAASNATAVGFQVVDAKGEQLMQTVPLDWTGWHQVVIDPTAGGMAQAYVQDQQDGKLDLPLKSVHVVWLSKAAGPTSLTIDGLLAKTPAGPGSGMRISTTAGEIAEPDQSAVQQVIAENLDDVERTLKVHYTVQANPRFLTPQIPDPELGVDHAEGLHPTVTVDGKDSGDALTSDGDDQTGFSTPWGSGFKEAVLTLDLGQVRQISAVRLIAGDANWVWEADASTSTDGTAYAPVASCQGLDLHGKWGTTDLPWGKAVAGRYLRLRFHHRGEGTNSIRLPATIKVYDGIANDQLTIPEVGRTVLTGDSTVVVPAHGLAGLTLRGSTPLDTGAYLIGLEVDAGGRRELHLANRFVRPAGQVDTARTQRFGMNSSEIDLAAELRRCGFGWIRFENAKWQMFCPQRGTMAFDGSVAPWHVDLDHVFGTYQQLGMKVLPYVFQTPDWASSAPAAITKNRAGYPPKDNADYGEAIFQLVARFGRTKVAAEKLQTTDKKSGLGLIDAVELWNEPNLVGPDWAPFVGPMPQYFEVMRAGVEGARKADPTLPISAGGFAGLDLQVVGQLAEHHYADGTTPLDAVDIINVHFYSGREEPEICGWDPNVFRDGPPAGVLTYPEQLAALVAWRDLHKPKAQIWLTETGYDVGGPIGRTERHQAGKLPRCIMLALAAGIDKVLIYREKGSTPSMHAGAGLLRNDGSLRASWFTIATLIRQLQGIPGGALRLPTADRSTWVYLWRDGARQIVTGWTFGGTAALGLDLGTTTACDAFGLPLDLTAGTAAVQLSEFPTYLTVTKPSPALTQLIAKATADEAIRRQAWKHLSDVPIALFDFGPDAQVGMLYTQGMPRRFTAVDKDRVWDDQLGYGFSKPALGNEDAHWIPDPLTRDGCRVDPSVAFRLRLPAGTHQLRINAESLGKGDPIEVSVTANGTTQAKTTDATTHLVELTVDGGGTPIEISLKSWGILRWMTAIGTAGTKSAP